MRSAAKSLRLAFRRASVTKAESRPGGDVRREPSENQTPERDHDAEILYAKLRKVLGQPSCSGFSPATRLKVLKRLAKEENWQGQERRVTQSTAASERSETEWEAYGDRPETVASEADIDGIVQSPPHCADAVTSSPQNFVEYPVSVGEFPQQKKSLFETNYQPQVTSCCDEPLCDPGLFAPVHDVRRKLAEMDSNLTNLPKNVMARSSLQLACTNTAQHPENSSVDEVSELIEMLRGIPIFLDFTHEQLIDLFSAGAWVFRTFLSGESIVEEGELGDSLVFLYDGLALESKRSCRLSEKSSGRVPEERVLIGPAYIGGQALIDPSSQGRSTSTVRAESTAFCIIIKKEAIEQSLSDISLLLDGCMPSPRRLGEIRSLNTHVQDFIKLHGSHEDEPSMINFRLRLLEQDVRELPVVSVLQAMLRIVRLQTSESDLALFVVDLCAGTMSRIRPLDSEAEGAVNLPVQGIAGCSATLGLDHFARNPSQDTNFDPVIDIGVGTGLLSTFVFNSSGHSTPRPEITIIIQVVHKTIEDAAADAHVFKCAIQQIRHVVLARFPCFINMMVKMLSRSMTTLSIRVNSFYLPLSLLGCVSTTGFQATLSMRLVNGLETLHHSTSSISSKTLNVHDGIAHFDFDTLVNWPDSCIIGCLPPATRVIIDFRVDPRPPLPSHGLRRRSSVFGGFSGMSNDTVASRSQTDSETAIDGSAAGNGVEGPKILSASSREPALIGWSGTDVYDHSGALNSEKIWLNCWIGKNFADAAAPQSSFEHPHPTCAVQLQINEIDISVERGEMRTRGEQTNPTGVEASDGSRPSGQNPDNQAEIGLLMAKVMNDSFYVPSAAELKILWQNRHVVLVHPRMLPSVMQSVDWADPWCRAEAYRLLDKSKLVTSPEVLLRLLGLCFSDPRLRGFAVRCLEDLDTELYMLQLVHALRHERSHDSALARFLLCRSLQSPLTYGQQFFWLLKADMQDTNVCERYAILLDTYVRALDNRDRANLRCQTSVIQQIGQIHKTLISCDSAEDKQAKLRCSLRAMRLPTEFVLPLNPRKKLCGIDVDKCRVLGSKQKPLYLVFREVCDAKEPVSSLSLPSLHILYKSGDDLRQDQLVLQLFRVMNHLWDGAGLIETMRLVSYGCVSVGPKCGLIEVVRDAETIASIFSMRVQQTHNSQQGTTHHKLHTAIGVMTEQNVLVEWLLASPTYAALNRFDVKEFNEVSKRVTYEDTVRTFAGTCAASCVASYVLGIGDRHNDNIMMSRTGAVFHIDFGHILGNFKTKFGFKRERTMFVFTPAFAAVLMSSSDTKTKISPPSGHETHFSLEGVKKRQHAFLKHLKHTRHSKSCHLEYTTTRVYIGRDQPTGAIHTQSDRSEPSNPFEDRRLKWQQTIHGSLRFSTDQCNDFSTIPAYEQFTQLCCDGYNVLRQHAGLLYGICSIMTRSSLPELQSEDDLTWLRTQLVLDVSNDAASAHFLKLLKQSVLSRSTLLNDAAHMLKHG